MFENDIMNGLTIPDIDSNVESTEIEFEEVGMVFSDGIDYEKTVVVTEEEVTDNDIMETTYSVLEKYPSMLTSSTNQDQFVVSLFKKMEEFGIIVEDPAGYLEYSDNIKDFLFLIWTGFLTTKSTIGTKGVNQCLVYIPMSQTYGDINVVSVGGNLIYKRKPVITSFSKSKFDEIYRKFYKDSSFVSQNIVDYLKQTTDSDIFVKREDRSVDLSTGFFSNTEILSMLFDGEITEDDLSTLPENRRNAILKIYRMAV